MIDRVARALVSADIPDNPLAGLRDASRRTEWGRHAERVLEALAVAAIGAMREPTNAMCAAAWHRATEPVWRAMIDAALSEQTEGVA